MKKLKLNIFALLAAAGSMLTACSDDVLDRTGGNDPEKGVILYVPELDASTRAYDPELGYDPAEAEYHSLHLFAYQEGKTAPEHIDLLGDDAEKLGGGKYKLNLDNGFYKMYVVANVDVDGDEEIGELLGKKIEAPKDLSKGLPMGCGNSELTTVPARDGDLIEVTSDGALTITANMKFAVARVQVTMLNDMRPKHKVQKITVNNHAADGTVLSEKPYNAKKGEEFSPAYGYFKCPAVNANDINETVVDGLDPISNIDTHTGTWAAQTVFYVAETLDKDGDDVPALAVALGENATNTDEAKVKLGEKIGNKISLQRSHFYKYVGTADGKFELTVVKPWTPAIIAGALAGPSTLEVDKTSVVITAGETDEIKYSSNKEIFPVSQQYNDHGEMKDIFIFDMDTKSGYILVSLNSDIDAGEFETVKAENKWKTFTITAGNIVKTIQVEDIRYDEYLTSVNNMLTIDVNERKQSGVYNGTDTIKVRTNLTDIRIYDINSTIDVTKWESQEYQNWKNGSNRWPDITTSNTDDPALQLVSLPGNTPIVFDNETAVSKGELKIGVKYNDLNSKRELWKQNTDLRVLVTGKDHAGNLKKQIVYIYVRSTRDTYRIHLKAKGWNAPHIYVYQALQLPSNHYSHPNVPVGYNHDGYRAALEYDFTGGIAFKGWYSDEKNDPFKMRGKYTNQFYVFDNQSEWDLDSPNTDHYNLIDFCSAHRAALATNKNGKTRCDECSREEFRRGFPGICMLPEGDDWWYFDLTGVATPGKALIMFTDAQQYGGENNSPNHDLNDGDRGNRRYPKHLSPGVALFDYPNREGWFVWKDQETPTVFYSSKEAAEGGVIEDNYDPYEGEPAIANGNQRIYFRQGAWSTCYAHIWKGGSNTMIEMKKVGTTAGDGWFYMDIKKGDYTRAIFKPNEDNWNNQVPSKDVKEDKIPTFGSDERVYYGSDGYKTTDFHIYKD